MLKLDIKVDGEKVRMPEHWEEITTSQYIELQQIDPNDKYYDAAWFAVMIGVSKEDVLAMKGEEGFLYIQDAKIRMAETMPDLNKLAKNKYMKWKGKKYKIPQDLSKLSIGQKISFESSNLFFNHMFDKIFLLC